MVVKVAYFELIAGELYKLGPDDILCHYVLEHEKPLILVEAHASVAGGLYAGKVKSCNILQEILWWPSIHSYAMEYSPSCDVCQCMGKP